MVAMLRLASLSSIVVGSFFVFCGFCFCRFVVLFRIFVGYIAETCAHGQSVPLNPAKPKIQARDFQLSDINAR